jgi:hypothetical protein
MLTYSAIALPRGRPLGIARDGPITLPLPGVRLPAPTWEFGQLFILSGHPVQWIGERWRESEAWACPVATMPDPDQPGIRMAIRMVDAISGEILPAVAEHVRRTATRVLLLHDQLHASCGRPRTFRSGGCGPRPLRSWEIGFSVGGQIYMFVGERWREGDEHAAPSPCFADSQQPGVMLTTRLLGPSGKIVSPVSSAEFASAILPATSLEPRVRLARLDGP